MFPKVITTTINDIFSINEEQYYTWFFAQITQA